jgi:peptidase M28-like protein
MRFVVLLLVSALSFRAEDRLTPEMQAVVSHISADSLRGHLSFIASDLLEGRATPSRGLDVAADYIAAQFRRAGLEPAGDDGYFQTATLTVREPNWDGFEMTVTGGGKTTTLTKSQVYLMPDAALDLDNVEVVPVDGSHSVSPEFVNGKAVLVTDQRAMARLQGSEPALVLSLRDSLGGAAAPQVRDPEISRRGPLSGVITRRSLADLAGETPARVTIHMAAPFERRVKVRNVAGILRGSDPSLQDTYVMLTAHYDHVGVRADNRVYNGANDDGSGTVSVIEIGGALATMNPHPKRSILFVAFFGEERGLLGSRYYGRHPLVPLDKTVADLNLEQIGRTDASNGAQVGTVSITGFDFSDLPRIVADAGQLAGVRVYKDNQASDAYFARSDNQALADAGIPAHTLCVAFEFPDYHAVGDHWDKIDYANMALVDDAVAIALLRLASDSPPPKWNESYPAARRYAEAARKVSH